MTNEMQNATNVKCKMQQMSNAKNENKQHAHFLHFTKTTVTKLQGWSQQGER